MDEEPSVEPAPLYWFFIDYLLYYQIIYRPNYLSTLQKIYNKYKNYKTKPQDIALTQYSSNDCLYIILNSITKLNRWTHT